MKTTQLIVSIIGATLGAVAFAQEATPDTWMQTQATKSRAEVQAELEQARKDGTIGFTGSNYNFAARVPAVKTRAQVNAELMAAKESGEFHALNSEAYDFTGASRSPVYAKARQ
jgi:hypothetical protein